MKVINWLRTKYYKWRCSKLQGPFVPMYPTKLDGTKMTDLEYYKLALYVNSFSRKKAR